MDHDKTLVFDHAHGNQALLSVIHAIVDPRQDISLENQRGIENVDASLSDDLPSLSLIPFEFQTTAP
jgi:hypothetical protein